MLARAEKKDEWVGVDKVLGTNNFTFVCAAQRLYSFSRLQRPPCLVHGGTRLRRNEVPSSSCVVDSPSNPNCLVPSSSSLFVTSSCDSHRDSMRVCSKCHEALLSSSFSKSQWVKRATVRRCCKCVAIAMVCLSSSSV